MIEKTVKEVYKYLGPTGTIVCTLGGAIIMAPIAVVIHNNIVWNEVTTYKSKLAKAGVIVSYDFCEGNREYIKKQAKQGKAVEIVICTQKSRTKIGEKNYIMSVLTKASGIKP